MLNIIDLNPARTGAFTGPFSFDLQDAFCDDFATHDVIDAPDGVPIGGHRRGLIRNTENWCIVSGEQLRPRW